MHERFAEVCFFAMSILVGSMVGVVSFAQRPDLDQVVGEDAVSAPGSGTGDTDEFGAVPAVAAFDVVDAAFASGAPFELGAEGSSVFELAACCAGFALARDGDVTHAEVVQFVFDLGFAVAAVSGRGARGAAGAALYPLDRRGQLRRVGRVADLDVVVEDDAVFVVDDLCLLCRAAGNAA